MSAPPRILPDRLARLKCESGEHWPGDYRAGAGYAGYEEGTQRCTVCGAWRTVSGGKTYKPPYWAVSYGEWSK